mgnify:CR=1 FL=1
MNSDSLKEFKFTPEDFPHFSCIHPPKTDYDYTLGSVFVLDKPKGWTSFRAVGLLKKFTGIKKIGHAGTLDPMATGLLVLCTGKATKTISQIQDGLKTYIAEVTFGAATASYDAESEITDQSDCRHITEELIQKTLEETFLGQISQIPPMFSALKVQGRRLYTLARKGIEVERKPRQITIHANTLLSFNTETQKAEIEVTCSKGTYIRTLAHDLGLTLGTHAHLTALRRTASGTYSVDQALSMEQLTHYFGMDGKVNLD